MAHSVAELFVNNVETCNVLIWIYFELSFSETVPIEVLLVNKEKMVGYFH